MLSSQTKWGLGLCSTVVLASLVTTGCEGVSEPEVAEPNGPGALTTFERAALEELAADHVTDAHWVASGTSGGTFPRLAYAYRLPGRKGGILGLVTVDSRFPPDLFDPFCKEAEIEGLEHCLRIRKRVDGSYRLQVYFTLAPDETPRTRPELTYAGSGQVATVRFRPQPLRIWLFRFASGETPVRATAELDERFRLTATGRGSVRVSIQGALNVDLTNPRAIEAELSVGGFNGCESLRLTYESVHGQPGHGAIACGPRQWAELSSGDTPDRPVVVTWLD